MKKEIPEDIKLLLKQVADHFDQEDSSARERQLRTWRRLKLVWEGFQRTWYSEVAHDWRIYDEQNNIDSSSDQAYYDKPVNVFRAYLESIIAALSITIPPIKCFPDDADNPLDLSTAKAGDKIAELLYRHNNAPLLWLHALFIFVTEGMTACYAYPKADEEYGTYEKKEYREDTEQSYVCPFCQSNLADDLFMDQQIDKFQPDDDDVELDNVLLNEHQIICPECAALLDPELQKSTFIVTKLIGSKTLPKSRICTEVYGGLYVKVPNWAMKQADIPYLIFSYETHYTNAIERYPNLRDKDGTSKIGPGSGSNEEYERWARLNPQYYGEFPTDTVTVRNCWLRPSSFNFLPQPESDALKHRFPDGAKVVLVNDQFADACNESLDDCWTITQNPMSDFIHHDPLGLSLVNIQEITNEIISLVIQTIEHGIPQTFVDPAVVNLEKYRQTEATPGALYSATPRTGKSVGDGFYEVKTATLSQEVLPFFEQVQSLGQLVSGATPALFGGAIQGSRTASEYSMSRAQALQRLQNTWKMFTMWWKTIYSKTIPMYMKEIQEDERSVERDSEGNFVNVFIRRAEIEGKIGRVELEANENLPLTWSQQKDVYMELLEKQNPQILEALASPENIQMLSRAIGLNDFVVPGEDDRQKQYEEIKQLINSEPIMVPPDLMMQAEAAMTGQEPQEIEESSVPIDPDVDNHDIEADICRRYLVSQAGRLLKLENSAGYKNVLLHMKAHMTMIQQAMMEAQQAAQQQAKPDGTSTPLIEETNVATE